MRKRYEFAEWGKARVNIDYHIAVDHDYYSVPHALVYKEVETRLTLTTLQAFFRSRRVASHARLHGRGRYSTLDEHMPEVHRRRPRGCTKATKGQERPARLGEPRLRDLGAEPALGSRSDPTSDRRGLAVSGHCHRHLLRDGGRLGHGARATTELVLDALKMAVRNRGPESGLIHHSDHGGQYTSLAFTTMPAEAGIPGSMGSASDA